MRTVRLNKASYGKVLSAAQRTLRWGGTVVAPTDTVYGILGDATKTEVIKKIFAMKGRPKQKALPIFVKDIAAARKYAYISDAKTKFLERIWPGPITVVFNHKEKLPKVLAGKEDTIAIRIPKHPLILELSARLDFPLVQTSANISNKPPAKDMKEIKSYFSKARVKPNLVISSGKITGQSSTVIDYTGKEPIILRTGPMSRTELDRMLSSF